MGNVSELIHFDPVTLVVLLGGFVATWVTLKKDSSWHTEWIKKHSRECDEQRYANSALLSELRATNAHLATLVEAHHSELTRLDKEVSRIRDRQDSIVDSVAAGRNK